MGDQKVTLKSTFEMEFGGRLKSPTINYRTWGKRKPDGSNVVWVCHALTANADVMAWWPGLFGSNDLFNPNDYFIISANILGSCYGTTGPTSENSEKGKPYYADFPLITIRDIVQLHRALASELGITRIGLLIGGSLGGQQALEWSIQEPERFEKMVLLATNAIHSPWGVAFNEAQRMAIEADASWLKPQPDAGMDGMRAARATALLSYRSYQAFAKTQSPLDGQNPWQNQQAASYQRYQGEKLAGRFNAWSYWYLSKSMDSHDIGRGRNGILKALTAVKADTLVISIESDILFPVNEQFLIANGIDRSKHVVIQSAFGHDGFLIETNQLSAVIGEFLDEKYIPINTELNSKNNQTNSVEKTKR